MRRDDLLELIRPERRRVVVSAILGIVQGLMLYPTLFLLRELFDSVIPHGHAGRAVLVCTAILVTRLAAGEIALAQRTMAMRAAKGAAAHRRRQLLRWLLEADVARLEDEDPARLQSRLVHETERLDVMLNRAMSQAVPSVVAAVLALGAMTVLNWQLTLVTLVLGVPASWLAARGGRNAATATHEFQQSFERFTTSVQFVVRHLLLVRSRGHVVYELQLQDVAVNDLRDRGVTMAVAHARMGRRQSLTVTTVAVAVLALGSILVIDGSLTVGGLAAFYVSALACGNAAGQVGSAVPELMGGLIAAQRLRELTDASGSVHSVADGTEVPIGVLPMRIDGVAFRYGTRPVLTAVDLELSAGRHVDLTGANGAGKSTLVRLVLGLERPESGSLTAAGVDVSDLDGEEVRRRIGYSPQRPTFFTGSVLDNLLYGRPGATRRDAARAIDLAGIAERVEELDGGMDAPLGEDGVRLSGGEGQRLAIARALIGNPDLVILDEPGNHLPLDAVARIIERIRRDRPDVALLTIGHGHLAAGVADVTVRLVAGRLKVEVLDD